MFEPWSSPHCPHQFVLQLLGLGLVQCRGFSQIDLIRSRESYTVCELSSLLHIESKVQILILALLNTCDKNFQRSCLDIRQSQRTANEGPGKTDESFSLIQVLRKFAVKCKVVRATIASKNKNEIK